MALLGATPRPALPSVASAVYRLLARADNAAMGMDNLFAFVAPPSVVGAPDSVRAAVRALVDLRILEDVKGSIQITDAYQTDQPVSEQSFRDLLRRAVLDSGVNEKLFANEDGAREFTRALAWFLAQSVDDPPATHDARDSRPYAAALLDEQMTAPKKREVPILRNKDRWPAFVRWSRYLGFSAPLPIATPGLTLIQPDPTEAVRRALATSEEPKGKELELVELVRMLADVLPVLDGGLYRKEVEARMAAAPVPPGGEGALSASLSLALLRLRADGIVTLTNKADARHALAVAVTPGEPQRWSHVKLARRTTSR